MAFMAFVAFMAFTAVGAFGDFMAFLILADFPAPFCDVADFAAPIFLAGTGVFGSNGRPASSVAAALMDDGLSAPARVALPSVSTATTDSAASPIAANAAVCAIALAVVEAANVPNTSKRCYTQSG